MSRSWGRTPTDGSHPVDPVSHVVQLAGRGRSRCGDAPRHRLGAIARLGHQDLHLLGQEFRPEVVRLMTEISRPTLASRASFLGA